MTLSVAIGAAFKTAGSPPFAVDAAFEVGAGQTLILLGPSGSGKTLILETIAGLHRYQGQVTLEGVSLNGRRPERRGFGLVFQDYALFPHLCVRDNVAFGIRYNGSGADPDQIMQRLDIAHLATRYPTTLSGGEQQRVALGRALAVAPRALLLDEPLSSLDLPAREALRARLIDLLAGVTAVYVTHDRDEACILGDRIAVVRDGQIVQIGSPAEVFARPANAFVARFTGANVIALADLPSANRKKTAAAAGEFLVVRPENIRLTPAGNGHLQGRVSRIASEGAQHRVTVATQATTLEVLTVELPSTAGPVSLDWSAEQTWIV